MSAKSASVAVPKWAYAAALAAVLIPCLWQSRPQAGDLSSHIYNAWLVQLIEAGKAQGLAIVPAYTNVLFDHILSALLPAVGVAWTQKIALSLAAGILGSGAFAFISRVSGTRPWTLLPALLILAHGWVLHAGFCNFYLSLGICLWALAIGWDRSRTGLAIAAMLLCAGWYAHLLPVIWSMGLFAYAWLWGKVPAPKKLYLLGGAVAMMVLLRLILDGTGSARWYFAQLRLATGADQSWVFDDKYVAIFVALLALLAARAIRVALGPGAWGRLPFQLWAITASIILIMPTAVILFGIHATFLADRMSLPSGICLLAWLAPARSTRFERIALIGVALVYFGFLYRDEHMLNAFEDRLEQTVASLPPMQRVVSAIDDPTLRVNGVVHLIDRVCIGRCFSFANYEPSIGEFRVRVIERNGIVAATYPISWALQTGEYRVEPRDLPLYQINLTQTGEMVARPMEAGERGGITYTHVLEGLF